MSHTVSEVDSDAVGDVGEVEGDFYTSRKTKVGDIYT